MPSLNTGNAILSNPIKVDSSYNVGIGGAASGSFKLQVTGTGNFTGALSGTSATFSSSVGVGGATNTLGFLEVWKSGSSIAQLSIGQNATYHTDFFVDTTGNFYVQPQGNTRMTIASGGNITWNGGDASGWFGGFSNSGTNFAYMGATSQFANSGGTSTDFGIRSANALAFYTSGGNERMRITSTGVVELNAADATYIRYSYLGTTKALIGVAGASSDVISGAAAGDTVIRAQQKMLFSTGGDTERMRITSGGNVLIGNPSDTSPRLSVQGIANSWTLAGFGSSTTGQSYGLVISAGTNSTDSSLYVLNQAGNAVYFRVRGDGLIQTGTAAASPYNNTSGAAANMVVTSGGTLERSTSSLKYKTDVKDYTKGLNEVLQLRPVFYKGKGKNDGDKQYAGLIAEEVHDLGLTEFVQYAEDETPDALAYQNMIALAFKAIQEQTQIIKNLEARIVSLESK